MLLVSDSSVFPFVACAFGIVGKKRFANPRSQGFTSVFSSRDFIVLALTLRCVAHFHCMFHVWCAVVRLPLPVSV